MIKFLLLFVEIVATSTPYPHPLRPIVSTISSASYHLVKYLRDLIPLRVGENTTKTSVEFVNIFRDKSFKQHDIMISFDVISLFTRGTRHP